MIGKCSAKPFFATQLLKFLFEANFRPETWPQDETTQKLYRIQLQIRFIFETVPGEWKIWDTLKRCSQTSNLFRKFGNIYLFKTGICDKTVVKSPHPPTPKRIQVSSRSWVPTTLVETNLDARKLTANRALEARSTLPEVIFREESGFEVKNGPNPKT